MSVYFETQQTVIKSTPMADFTFGFTESSFLLLNGQKHLRSVAEDLISNKQKGTERMCQKLSTQYFSTGHNFVSFLLGVSENKYHVMKRSSVQLKVYHE